MKSGNSKSRGPKEHGKKPATSSTKAPAKPPARFPYFRHTVIGGAAALCIVFVIYGRAMNGPFLLDDHYLAYDRPDFANLPLIRWIWGLRPLLMLSYWLNFQLSGGLTYSYHLVNVILHFLNGVLVFLALRKLLQWAGTSGRVRETTAIFAAGLFWLHPLQTESVSYIASRSETMSVFFFLAAFVVFLYRKSSKISILAAIGVLVCFGAACLTKEHTVILPALLLLTDYYWNPGFSLKGVWRNWRLYVPIVVLAAIGGAYVLKVVLMSSTAGFHVFGLTWYQYFFTQCRVIWRYILLFVLPFWQNLDADVPISQSIADHWAFLGLLALLAASVAAWIYRRRFPLASYGWFVFLFLLAPTSSVIPIADPYAERRLYLPFIGLLLIAAEFVRRWKSRYATVIVALGSMLLLEAALTFRRNGLWNDPVALWKVTAEDSPQKYRPSFQYAMSLFEANRDRDAVDEYARTASLVEKPSFDLLVDWGLAYDRMGDHAHALEKLKAAAAIESNSLIYTQLAKVYSEQENYADALQALQFAERFDPANATVFRYRGNIFLAQGNKDGARQQFRRAVELDQRDEYSRQKLAELGG